MHVFLPHIFYSVFYRVYKVPKKGFCPWANKNISFNINNVNKAFMNSSGQWNAVSFNATSDLRLKENITSLTNSLLKINQLHGVNFTWKNNENNKINAGLIAQDVEKVIPEVVDIAEHENEEGFQQKSINYDGLIPYLIESVKTLSTEKDNMQQEIDSLKLENEAMKEKMKQYDEWFAQLLNK